VWCVILCDVCYLCLIVVSLSLGKSPFAVEIIVVIIIIIYAESYSQKKNVTEKLLRKSDVKTSISEEGCTTVLVVFSLKY
jgi:hypothetical protein